MPDDKTKSADKVAADTIPVGAPADGGVGVAVAADGGLPAGGIAAGGGGIDLPAGGITLDVGADVTSQLAAALPSFGNVLSSIGLGVADSQTQLDNSVIETIHTLNDVKIKVVTDVVEVLGDDGLPDAAQTQIITEDVSVLNFFTPTIHEWKNVSISMDIEVGAFHDSEGMTFSKEQHSESVTATGLFWGFLGWFDTEDKTVDDINSTTINHESRWQKGNVRVDALLGPRRTSKLPVPDTIEIGPQIFVSQGAVAEQVAGGVTTARTVDLEIVVRKTDGSPNPAKNILVNAGGLLPSFPAGSTTDADGKIKATLTRALFPGFSGFQRYAVTASLGMVRKTFNVTL